MGGKDAPIPTRGTCECSLIQQRSPCRCDERKDLDMGRSSWIIQVDRNVITCILMRGGQRGMQPVRKAMWGRKQSATLWLGNWRRERQARDGRTAALEAGKGTGQTPLSSLCREQDQHLSVAQCNLPAFQPPDS